MTNQQMIECYKGILQSSVNGLISDGWKEIGGTDPLSLTICSLYKKEIMNIYQTIATILLSISFIGFWSIKKEIIKRIKT